MGPGGADGGEATLAMHRAGSIPGWGTSPGDRNGNPFPVFSPGKSRTEAGYQVKRSRKEPDKTDD